MFSKRHSLNTLAATVSLLAAAGAHAQPSITLTPLGGGLVDVPAMSTPLLVVLALLLGAVAYFLAGTRGFNRISSIAIAGTLAIAGSGSALYTRDASAGIGMGMGMGMVPILPKVSLLSLSGGETRVLSFDQDYCITNSESFDQSVAIDLGGGIIAVTSACGVYGTPDCTDGLTLAAGESCNLRVNK